VNRNRGLCIYLPGLRIGSWMMKKHIGFLGALAFVVLTAVSAAFGQQTGLVKTDPSRLTLS
ncbi:MAG TPA: hypothetical protein PLN05_17505, partial [Pyrinomonadaceae bacterium]|nr:hypothetical protein [Pyrinomonadaceae bacterium]HRK52218.1 hypothetical protein [Pyrinomonadaceae bacterium]